MTESLKNEILELMKSGDSSLQKEEHFLGKIYYHQALQKLKHCSYKEELALKDLIVKGIESCTIPKKEILHENTHISGTKYQNYFFNEIKKISSQKTSVNLKKKGTRNYKKELEGLWSRIIPKNTPTRMAVHPSIRNKYVYYDIGEFYLHLLEEKKERFGYFDNTLIESCKKNYSKCFSAYLSSMKTIKHESFRKYGYLCLLENGTENMESFLFMCIHSFKLGNLKSLVNLYLFYKYQFPKDENMIEEKKNIFLYNPNSYFKEYLDRCDIESCLKVARNLEYEEDAFPFNLVEAKLFYEQSLRQIFKRIKQRTNERLKIPFIDKEKKFSLGFLYVFTERSMIRTTRKIQNNLFFQRLNMNRNNFSDLLITCDQ